MVKKHKKMKGSHIRLFPFLSSFTFQQFKPYLQCFFFARASNVACIWLLLEVPHLLATSDARKNIYVSFIGTYICTFFQKCVNSSARTTLEVFPLPRKQDIIRHPIEAFIPCPGTQVLKCCSSKNGNYTVSFHVPQRHPPDLAGKKASKGMGTNFRRFWFFKKYMQLGYGILNERLGLFIRSYSSDSQGGGNIPYCTFAALSDRPKCRPKATPNNAHNLIHKLL